MTRLLKAEIREFIRPLRALISPDYRKKAGLAAAALFKESPLFKNNQYFACYWPLPTEMDSLPLIALLQQEKSCYLPVLTEKKALGFARYHEGLSMRSNRLSILEPENSPEVRSAAELDLILLPLLAFDPAGNRLGTGGGFYDYSLAFLREQRPHKPLLLGLGYELQQVPEIPREAFDVPLDGVLTEEKLITFSSY